MGANNLLYNIAIDGLPASGKDTLTEILFYSLNHLPETNEKWKVIDSSAMWRSLSLFLEDYYEKLGITRLSFMETAEKGMVKTIDIKQLRRTKKNSLDYKKIVEDIMPNIYIETDFEKNKATIRYTGPGNQFDAAYSYIDLKTTKVDVLSGYIATFNDVRPFVVDMERKTAKGGSCLIPGRDGYSVVLNGVDNTQNIGLYSYADFDVRVKRRHARRNKTLEEVAEELRIRDKRDSKGAAGVPVNIEEALTRGYICIDNSKMNIYEIGVETLSIVLSQMHYLNSNKKLIEHLVLEANKYYNHSVPTS